MESLQYSRHVCITPTNWFRLLRQPKFWIALAVALPCGFAGGFLRFWQTYYDPGRMANVIIVDTPYDTLTFVTAFLSAFRILAAYQKFWQGCDHAYNIVGDFFDSAADLVAYTRGSQASPKEIDDFHQLIVRLFSILTSVVFADLETGAQRGDETGRTPVAYSFELFDVAGLDEQFVEKVLAAEDKVEFVYHTIECVIVDAWNRKIFSIDPPILARSMVDLSHGIEHFHEAQKITEVPFPFPYQMALQSLLVLHWIITPILTAGWTDYYFWCFFLCTAGVFSMWFFVAVAMDLDQPFAHTANSVDVRYLQRLMNHRLLSLLSVAKRGPPKLAPGIRRKFGRNSMTTASSTGGGLKEIVSRRSVDV